MESDQKSIPRKKFVLWGLAFFSFFSVLGMWFSKKKQKKIVRMLTQDGKLVEVDASALPAKGKKISDAELQSWVKK